MWGSLFGIAMTCAAGGGESGLSFTDQTAAAGLSFTHATTVTALREHHMMTPGVAVGDFNRDGWLDLFVNGGTGQNARLFINDGDGTFTDRAVEWGVDLVNVEGSSVTVGDIDGDGDHDLYVGALDGRNYLLLNTGSGQFVDAGTAATAVLISNQPFNTFGASFGDVDLDGDLDLVTLTWRNSTAAPMEGSRLFRNLGGGTFLDVTFVSGLFADASDMWGFTPALVDMNGDGRPDLPCAADFSTSRYYANLDGEHFAWMPDNGACTDENGMGAALADYDNDGDLDWFVTSIFDNDGVVEGNWGITGNRLYRNDGNHQFTDVTDAAGVRNGYWGWGTSFADFNLDGRLDLVMTNGFILPQGFNPDPTFMSDPTRLWLNAGDGPGGPAFVEVAAAFGLVDTGDGKGLVTFDADNDGDLDIVITNTHGPLRYFRNELDPAPERWIELDFVPPPGNAPDGIGATVDVTAGGLVQHRAVFGSPSFMSQDPLRVHVGFPADDLIDRIEVRWPDGTPTVLVDVTPGQVLTIRRGDVDASGAVDTLDLVRLLDAWGPCTGCPEDLDGDGAVGIIDLLILLAAWG